MAPRDRRSLTGALVFLKSLKGKDSFYLDSNANTIKHLQTETKVSNIQAPEPKTVSGQRFCMSEQKVVNKHKELIPPAHVCTVIVGDR